MRTTFLALLRRTVLATAAALAAVPAARGQSPWCTFPDPLSTAEVAAMLDRVGLAGTARETAMQTFEAYLAESLAIARDEIAPFCTETSGAPSQDDREVERRIATRKRIAGQLALADARLADAIAAAAGTAGEVKARLERERLERRHWMQLIGSRLERRDGAEFADGLAECGVAVDGEVLSALAARSAELTSAWRRLANATADEPLEMRQAIEAAGLKRPETGGQEAWEAYFSGMTKIRAEVRGRQREIRASIRRLQRDTERSLVALVGPEAGRKLRDWFIQRTYTSLLRPRNPVPPLLTEAERKAKSGEIAAESFADLQAIAAEHATRRAELDARLMDLLDARWAEGGGGPSFLAFEGQETGPDPTARILEDRAALDESTLARLREGAPGLEPPGEVERDGPRISVGGMELQIEAGAIAGGGTFVIQAGGDGGGGEGVAVVAMTMEATGGGRGRAISRDDLAAWSKRLGVPEDSMPLLEILLEDYLAKYAEIENGPLAELGGGGGPFGNPEIPASRRHDLMRDATERLLVLDAEFFANMAAALGGTVDAGSNARLGNERRRSVHREAMKGESGFGMIGMNESETFDLATVVAGVSLPDTARAALEPLLVAYDAEATPLLASSYARHASAARTAAIEQERLMQQMEQESQDGGEVRSTVFAGSPDAEAMERQQSAQREMNAATAAVRTALKASVAATVAALSDEDSRLALQDAVDRAAYPRFFRDPRSAGPRFDAALELPDLAPANREAIAAARRAWETEWRRITGDLVSASRELVAKASSAKEGQNQMPLLITQQETQQRLRFERSEANEKAMRDLKALLTPEQAKAVGELPPAPKRGPIMFGN
jgi:hypothetical protein